MDFLGIPALFATLWSIAVHCARRYGLVLRGCDPVSNLVMTATAAVGEATLLGRHPRPSFACVLVSAGVCAASDRQTGYIFDRVTLLGGCVALFAAAWEGTLPAALTGAALCGALLWVVRAASSDRGLGFGDVKLGALIGMLGVTRGLEALGSAFVMGAVVASVGAFVGRLRRGDAIRFGPYLAVGTAMCATPWWLG